jgi:septal ring factor EnvC (AmiA/AmiB activator)
MGLIMAAKSPRTETPAHLAELVDKVREVKDDRDRLKRLVQKLEKELSTKSMIIDELSAEHQSIIRELDEIAQALEASQAKH